ncbi:multinuclear nonheme iron-dependent oxidase [Streptomyces sp. NPDC001889]
MTAAAPTTATRLGLGLVMDMPWAGGTLGNRGVGFVETPGGGDISPRVRAFLRRHGSDFAYACPSFQPRSRAEVRVADYAPAYDRFYGELPPGTLRALHQTELNMGAPGPYDRGPAIDFTNELAARHDLAWVVEDLGIWSLRGCPLPYPLPPPLTERGLEIATRNTADTARRLTLPLHVEFPGFTEGGSFRLGGADAFVYFARLAEDADVPVTLDIGHLLSYQWLRGRTGRNMFDGIEDLPLSRCRELHLSGCQLVGGKFRDLHHGVLLDEQLELTEYLLPRCPNLVGVSYEDPMYREDGRLVERSRRNYERLRALAGDWRDGETAPGSAHPSPGGVPLGAVLPREEGLDEERLAGLTMRLLLDGGLRERLAAEGAGAVAESAGELECLETVDCGELDSAARRLRSQIRRLGRDGGLAAAFPESLRTLRAAGHTEPGLIDAFLTSPHFGAFRLVPYAGRGLSAEEAFARFLLGLPEAEARPRLRRTVGHELLLSLFPALLNEQPLSFDIEAGGIVRTDHGHAALRHYPPETVAGWAGRTPVPAGEGPETGEPVPYAYFATPTGFAHGTVSPRVAAAFETTPTPAGDTARAALIRRGLW